MFENEISDYHQQRIMQKYGRENLVAKDRILLKSLLKCGKAIVQYDKKKMAAVAVMANDKTARYHGLNSCKSPWCCPVCTSRAMAKYATKIGSALDALKEKNLAAAMITLTVPHTSGFTCEQITEILYNTWKAFVVHGNTKKAGSMNDVFANFMQEFDSKHRVRVCEYTWGEHGWHPHFHCLFWFPKDRIDEILKWEKNLNERWLELCKRYTIRQLLLCFPEEERKTARLQVLKRVEIMYSKLNDGSHGVYISKQDGKVIVQQSSNYLCGWGGNREITGNVQTKATNKGHYTWQQILQLAIDGDQTQNWWKLFFEYAVATRKYRHARINFSVHSGLSKIIAEYQNTQGYKNVLKKNAQDFQKAYGRWRTICWFTSSQWFSICNNDLTVEILKLAITKNALEKINELLAKYDIPPAIQNEEESFYLESLWNAA